MRWTLELLSCAVLCAQIPRSDRPAEPALIPPPPPPGEQEGAASAPITTGELHARLEQGLRSLDTFDAATELALVRTIRLAGERGDPVHRAMLSDLARRAATPTHRLVSLQAMDALHRLGEPDAAFLALIDEYREEPVLAANAILIVARAPSPELTARLDRIKEQSRHALSLRDRLRVCGAIASARRATAIAARCAKGTELRALVALLVSWAVPPPAGPAARSGSPRHVLEPVHVFAQRELHALSARAPERVAETLATLTAADLWPAAAPAPTPTSDAEAERARAQVRAAIPFLAPEARAPFEER